MKYSFEKAIGQVERNRIMKTQIYGTFGPACKSQEILENMIKCGMTGMRLNLSHTTLEKSEDYIQNYRTAAESQDVEPQILIDMQGPELRVGEMEETKLQEGNVIFLVKSRINPCPGKTVVSASPKREVVLNYVDKAAVSEYSGNNKFTDCFRKDEIPVPDSVMSVIEPEMEILLDDGKIRVKVIKVTEEKASAKVLIGGILKPQKSIKIVDVNVDMPVLTEHDISNLRKAKEYGVTALMQPFVFSGEDLKKVKAVLKEENIDNIQIFAKVENRIGVENLENIIPEADLIVIARGDLGNDMPLWELPTVQKKIETVCKKYGKPYMVVTQMLASMEHNPIPTRAEVSDIFHAVYHGAGAVMVTGETAVGKYPVDVIRYLSNTVKEAMMYQKNR